MRRLHGSSVFVWRPCGRMKRGFQITPRRGTKDYFIRREGEMLLMRWTAHRGLFVLAVVAAEAPHQLLIHNGFPEDWRMPPKRRVQAGELPPVPALSMESVCFKKYPLLVEFLACTQYEDKAKREPGYFTVRNRIIEYEITLYDPDSGQRIPIRARTLDELMRGCESVLGAENAPWEIDRYLFEQLEKKTKKKKVSRKK